MPSSSVGCMASNSGLTSRAARFESWSSLATCVSPVPVAPTRAWFRAGDSWAQYARVAGNVVSRSAILQGEVMTAHDEAVRYAMSHETPWPRDLRAHIEAGFFEPPPHNAILGPIRPRGGPNGLILRGGAVVARWGDTRQVDFTFS